MKLLWVDFLQPALHIYSRISPICLTDIMLCFCSVISVNQCTSAGTVDHGSTPISLTTTMHVQTMDCIARIPDGVLIAVKFVDLQKHRAKGASQCKT